MKTITIRVPVPSVSWPSWGTIVRWSVWLICFVAVRGLLWDVELWRVCVAAIGFVFGYQFIVATKEKP